MSSKVHTDFTSDGKQLLKTIQDSQKEIEKLTAENRKLRDESKAASKEAKTGFESGTAAVSGMLGTVGALTGGLTTVATLTKLASDAFDDWRSRVEKLKGATTNFHEQLVSQLRSAGMLMRGEEIEKRLTAIPSTTREQMEATFAGVVSSGPIGVDKALALAEAAAPRAQAGESADKLREFGSVMGEMSDIAAGRSAGDVADLTAKMQELVRGDFSKIGGAGSIRSLGKMVQAGMTPEDALGWAAAGIDVGVDTKSLGQAAAAAAARGMTFEQAVADPRKAKLGDQVAATLSLIDPAVAKKRAEEFRQAERDDLMQRGQRELGKSQAGLMVGMRQRGESEFDKSPSLSADATIEQIIANIDRGFAAHKNYFDRGIPAMEARFHTWRGDLPAEAALKAYGGAESAEYRAIHSPEENQFWREQLDMLRELVKLQREAAKQKAQPVKVVNPNAHVE